MRKDESLDQLAELGNVAQFVAFAPNSSGEPCQTYARLRGLRKNALFSNNQAAIDSLLERSSERTINVRSFEPGNPRSREFFYGIASRDEALAAINRLSQRGLHTIANETIDIHDGGVSGVIQGDVIEFAPDDTPRCVEKPGVAALPLSWGLSMLEKIYGAVPEPLGGRLEFSIHPRPRGYKNSHVLLWEYEANVPAPPAARPNWPNRFSNVLGDKVYGLLIANELRLNVPRTQVISRRIAPFSFGNPTGSREVWIRTCPHEPVPGLYTTRKGWTDPFALLQVEDPKGTSIASVLSQDAIQAKFSGAAIVGSDDRLVVEGRSGEGDGFMLGTDKPEALPEGVLADVRHTYECLRVALGAVRFEWVHDGRDVWIVQLHVGATQSSGAVLVPGEPVAWHTFDASLGLLALRDFLEELPEGAGLKLKGYVGLTSHIADLIRKSGKPARFL